MYTCILKLKILSVVSALNLMQLYSPTVTLQAFFFFSGKRGNAKFIWMQTVKIEAVEINNARFHVHRHRYSNTS